MKATTTLGNLIEQVETMSAGNLDETVSLNEIEFGSLNEMWIGGVGVRCCLKRRGFSPIGCALHSLIWIGARLNSRPRT